MKRTATLATVLAGLIAAPSFAQAPGPASADPAAPPQRPGAVNSEQQKKEAEKRKSEVKREQERRASADDTAGQKSDPDRSPAREATAPPSEKAPKPR